MGPRPWSGPHDSNAVPSAPATPEPPATPSVSPQVGHRELLQKSSPATQPVLHACERVKSRAGGAMAAARERSSSAKAAQEDLRHGFPIQVSLPDGETSHHHYNPSLRHNGGPEQEAEVLRGYLKPPENKSISDVDGMSPSRSCSMGVLRAYEEWEGARSFGTGQGHPQKSYSNTSSPHPQHRHSASLEAHAACPPHYSARGMAPGGSYPSSSSSMSSSSALGGSPRGRKSSFQIQFLPPFITTREKAAHEGGGAAVGGGGGGGGRKGRSGASRTLYNPQSIIRNSSAATALADIARVPCGAALDAAPTFPCDFGHDERMAFSPQGFCSPLSTEVATDALEEDRPPIYSEVIGNPALYRNISRTERRTDGGKI